MPVSTCHPSVLFFLLTLVVSGAAIAAALLDSNGLAGLFVLLAGGSLVLQVRSRTGAINNITSVFVLFFLLYGLAGPASILFGGELPSVFPATPATGLFLLQNALAVAGLAIGLFIATSVVPVGLARAGERARTIAVDSDRLLRLAFVTGAIASLMDLVNFYRVGGLAILTMGKAVYQSQYGDLFLTLPGQYFATISFALFAFALAVRTREGAGIPRRRVVLYLFVVFPVLLIPVILGQRGFLLSLAMTLVVGISFYQPIRSISARTMAIVVAGYFVLSLLFVIRSTLPVAITTGNWELPLENVLKKDRLARSVNPNSNEFGAAFGNFSTYAYYAPFDRDQSTPTYIEGLAVPVPGFLYPGEKPKQIPYRFRDAYFPEQAAKARIAGSGFSSILEAYMNFGVTGPLVVYFLLGMLLVALERIRYRAIVQASPFRAIVYLMLLPLAQSFHRSAFGVVFGEVLISLLILCFIWSVAFVLRSRSARRAASAPHPLMVAHGA